jgi:hypothetical protein
MMERPGIEPVTFGLQKLNHGFWGISVWLPLFPLIRFSMRVCGLSVAPNQETHRRRFATVSLAER